MSNYDLYKNKSYNLRIPNILREKAQKVATIQGYKKMSHFYEHVISAYIAAYEARHGEIQIGGPDLPVTDQTQEQHSPSVDYVVFDDNGEPMFTIETAPKKEVN